MKHGEMPAKRLPKGMAAKAMMPEGNLEGTKTFWGKVAKKRKRNR